MIRPVSVRLIRTQKRDVVAVLKKVPSCSIIFDRAIHVVPLLSATKPHILNKKIARKFKHFNFSFFKINSITISCVPFFFANLLIQRCFPTNSHILNKIVPSKFFMVKNNY